MISTGELFVILLVALVVFGPKKLPLLSQHLGLFLKKLKQQRSALLTWWDTQCKELNLQQNIKKAETADALYEKQKNGHNAGSDV